MQKRGQVYILTVIILAFVIYLLYTDTNIVKQTIIDDDFEELAQNYEVESAKFVNYLLLNNFPDSGIRQFFEDFTSFFTSYSKTKNPDFGLLYLFDYNNRLYVGNYLDEDVDIVKEDAFGNPTPLTSPALAGCNRKIPAGFNLAGGNWQQFRISVGDLTNCAKSLNPLTSPTDANYDIGLQIGDVEYGVEITKGKPDIVIVGREEKGNQRKVYTKGNFEEPITLDLGESTNE